jgi:hypothetical protein
LEAEITDTGWKRSSVPDAMKSYEYRYENVIMVLCPIGRGADILSVGPLLAPLIPVPGEGSRRKHSQLDFSIEVVIESSDAVTSIDLSKVRVELPGGRSLEPIDVSSERPTHKFPDVCNYLGDFKKLPIQEYEVSYDRRYIDIHFLVPHWDVEECIIDLGTIMVNGKGIKLPSLKFHKGSGIRYRPIILPLPS